MRKCKRIFLNVAGKGKFITLEYQNVKLYENKFYKKRA